MVRISPLLCCWRFCLAAWRSALVEASRCSRRRKSSFFGAIDLYGSRIELPNINACTQIRHPIINILQSWSVYTLGGVEFDIRVIHALTISPESIQIAIAPRNPLEYLEKGVRAPIPTKVQDHQGHHWSREHGPQSRLQRVDAQRHLSTLLR